MLSAALQLREIKLRSDLYHWHGNTHKKRPQFSSDACVWHFTWKLVQHVVLAGAVPYRARPIARRDKGLNYDTSLESTAKSLRRRG